MYKAKPGPDAGLALFVMIGGCKVPCVHVLRGVFRRTISFVGVRCILLLLLVCVCTAAGPRAQAPAPGLELAASVNPRFQIFLAVVGRHTPAPGLELAASVNPPAVETGDQVTYAITVRNPSWSTTIRITHVLPSGFTYIPGSTQVLSSQTILPVGDPVVTGSTLTWSGAILPRGRNTSFYGMHTFVQDRWDRTDEQLDRVVELMGRSGSGANAYAKQIFYGITRDTQGPLQQWIDFVNRCYDRNLIPVVRLEGPSGNPWPKPPADSNGGYEGIAQAFAHVVSKLPQRPGRMLYVEVWNEPNLGLEWGGQANPAEYGRFLVAASNAIRALGRSDVRVLNGGLSPIGGGASGPGDWGDLEFTREMLARVPEALWAFDVWATHSYPSNHPPEYNNHNGTAVNFRQQTIDSYSLELQVLADHGRAGVPVLLTEMGYAVGQNDFVFEGYPPIDENNRADYMARAYRDYWSRWPEVLGVCPFELQDPFGAWQQWDWVGHQQYDAVRALDKTPTTANGELVLHFRARVGSVPGNYGSQVTVAPASGVSLSLTGAASVQVYRPVCSSVLRNGGFERNEAWVIPNPARAKYDTSVVHSGKHAMSIGLVEPPTSALHYASVSQTFAVPPSATSLHIDFWYYPVSQGDTRSQKALLYDATTNTLLQTVMSVSSGAARWIHHEFRVYGYAGRTLQLYLGTFGPGGTTGMYVDDVNVQVCSPAGLPTVTPTPNVTATPTRTPAITPSPTATWDTTGWLRWWLPLMGKGGTVYGPSVGDSPAHLPEPRATPRPQPKGWQAEAATGLTSLALPAELGATPLRSLVSDPVRHRLILAAGSKAVALDTRDGRVLFTCELGTVGTLVVDTVSGATYALLPDRGELHILGVAGTLQDRVTGLGRPSNMVLGLGKIYIADSAQNRLVVLDGADYAIMAVQELPAAPHALALDPFLRRLYVGQMGTGMILAVNAETLDPIGQVALGGLGYPQDLVLDGATGRLYVAHARSPKYGAIAIIDTQSMTLLATREGNPQWSLFGSDTVCLSAKRGLVFLGQADGFLALDSGNLAVQSQISISRSAWPGTVAPDMAQGAIYIAGEKGQLFRWEPPTPTESPDMKRNHEPY